MNAQAVKPRADTPAATVELLQEGGDARIVAVSGRNEYGCSPRPDPDLVAFASSTASTLSESAFAAADALHQRIAAEANEATCEREFNRIREEFASLYGISDLDGLDILFAASGTDAHLIASRLTGPGDILMVEGPETGRGVPLALAGLHFSTRSAYRRRLNQGEALAGATVSQVAEVNIRDQDGTPRNGRAIDDEICTRVRTLVKKGGRVLLVLVDVSKTGMIAPSPSCAMELKEKFPDSLQVLVDACQFRMAPSTLKAYLEQGFMVAVTGSKFLTGPAFSGALLLPETVEKIRKPKTLAAYSSRFEWPARMRSGFPGTGTNFGLLLRWQAALSEIQAFRGIPETEVEKFLAGFADAIGHRLAADPNLEPLAVPPLDRRALTAVTCWDRIQTIFPFRLRRKGKRLGYQETGRIHALLQQDCSNISDHHLAALRCSLGQPVSCGEGGGGALRLCASARLAVEGREKPEAVINRALLVLDKIDLLLSLDDQSAPVP